jgi:hypothetical protein
MLSRGCPWVLCVDTLHHPDLDLTNPSLRKKLELLIDGGAFLTVGGGPPCSSLSIDVTPPIRCKQFPSGRPGLPPPVRERIRIGNLLANWMASVYRRCVAQDIAVWVENPDSSWLWRSSASGEWTTAGSAPAGASAPVSPPTLRSKAKCGFAPACMTTGGCAARTAVHLEPNSPNRTRIPLLHPRLRLLSKSRLEEAS